VFTWQRTAASDTNIFYPDIGLYDQDKRVAEPFADDLVLPSLTVTKSFGWADLTSVTSYFKRDFRRTTDGTLYNPRARASSHQASGFSMYRYIRSRRASNTPPRSATARPRSREPISPTPGARAATSTAAVCRTSFSRAMASSI
jgi:hypothetical protein